MDFSLILDSFNQAEAELQVIFGGAGGGQAVATVTLVLCWSRSAFLEDWLHESRGLVYLFIVIPPASRTAFPSYSRGLRNNCGRKGKREGSAFCATKNLALIYSQGSPQFLC